MWKSKKVGLHGAFEKEQDCACCMKNFYLREKSIDFYDVTMSYGFKNQISAFCDNYILFLFLHVFLSRHFLCDRFVKI